MHGMCVKTRTDTHVGAHMHACELANLTKYVSVCASAHASMHTHTRTHSTCRLVLPHYYGWQGVSGPLLFSKGSL